MKCVSNVSRELIKSLLRIHQMLVLSALEYGSSAYSSARLRNLKKLAAVHHNGIRKAHEARIENIMCEAGFTTLRHRRRERQIAERMMSIKNHQIMFKIISHE
jgi:hypothetical protein